MKAISLSTLFMVILGLLCIFSAMSVEVPPPTESDLFHFDEPREGSIYTIGENIHVHAITKGGEESHFYKKNVEVELCLKQETAHPAPDKCVGQVRYNILTNDGYDFKAEQVHTNPIKQSYQIRGHFMWLTKAYYVDSSVIAIQDKKFLRFEKDDQDMTWEQRVAKKYYDKLFKEYALVELKYYKEGRVAM
ncbi:hypothetical protein BGX28_007781 [Mortierella sp. GBA30]|nr:hypothetical protein BGX28_007781 [Mortierella sp. GBA30]